MMRRLRSSGSSPTPRPGVSWFAGVLIGSAIVTMATGAVMLGVGTAVQAAVSGTRRTPG